VRAQPPRRGLGRPPHAPSLLLPPKVVVMTRQQELTLMSALRPLHGESCATGYRDGAPFPPGARSFCTGPKGSYGEPSSSGPRGQRAFDRGKR
jgi:hypothetical protein